MEVACLAHVVADDVDWVEAIIAGGLCTTIYTTVPLQAAGSSGIASFHALPMVESLLVSLSALLVDA